MDHCGRGVADGKTTVGARGRVAKETDWTTVRVGGGRRGKTTVGGGR